METATNVYMRYAGVLETRPGFTSLGSSYSPVGAATASSLYVWLAPTGTTEYPIAHTRDNTIEYYVPSVWAAVSGTYADPTTDSVPVRFAEARKNLYFTTAAGPYRMTAYNVTPELAGIPKPLDIDVASHTTTSALALANDYAYAYRATIVYVDANGNQWESAPSHRLVFRNSSTYSYSASGAAGSTRDPTLRIYLPSSQMTGTATKYSVRLYRSRGISGAANEPSDEQGQVYELALTSTDISTNKYVDIRDRVADSLRGAAGYFSPGQEGILGANSTPPLADDFCWHGRRMLYANTTSKHRLTIRLLSGSLINADETIVIGGQTYTAKASGASGQQFNIITTYASESVNIMETARGLVRAVNANTNSSQYAYYMSGADDPPGIILLEERGIGGSSFAVTAGGAYVYWAPQLPTSGTTVSSDNDARANRVYISKQDQPEAVPLLSYVEVGTQADDIVRIMPLRDSVFVFKQREGIFRITGVAQGTPSVQLLDPTVRFITPKTVASVANELYCLSGQGVVAVSDTGVRIVSGPIDDLLSAYLVSSESLTYSYGIGDEKRRLYILALAESAGGSNAPIFAYVYSVQHDAWFKWSKVGGYAAAIGPFENELYISGFDTGGGSGAASDTCYKENTTYSDGGTAISVTTKWLTQPGADPSGAKHWAGADFIFDDDSTFTSATATFTTDIDTTGVTATLTPSAGQRVVPAPIGAAGQRGQLLGVQLAVAQDTKKTSLLGVVLRENETSEKGRR